MDLSWRVVLLYLLAVCASVSAVTDETGVRRIPLRAHSLQAPYLDSEMQSRYFDFGDDTIVRADQYIRLTSDRQGQSGWLWSKMPFSSTNWQVEVEFKVHGQGHLHGDGMAIWFTEERAQSGQVFGSKDNFNGLGVFIDTYKNGRTGVVFPYVMAMLGNSSVSYDKEKDGKANELAGCSARGIRTDDVATKIRLTYYQEKSLRVDLQYKAVDEWTECFETEAIKLPSTFYLGFSAETGEVTDNHDLISVTSHNLYIRDNKMPPGMGDLKDSKRPKSKPFNPGGDKERGSWRWFFLKIVIFGIVVVGSYVGYTMYRASNRGSRF